MAARDSLSFDDGMRTLSWLAVAPLRSRVSMSAIGSVIVIGGLLPSPAGLGHAGNLAGVDHFAEADPAQVELAVHGARPPAPGATGVGPYLELGLALLLLDERCLGHETPQTPLLGVSTSEREPEGVEQGSTLGVGAGGGDDGDVHATHSVDLVVVDLGEDQLLVHPEGVVAPPVEPVGRQAAEVTDARDGQGDEPVEELPHAVAPEGDLGPDGNALAQLERSD